MALAIVPDYIIPPTGSHSALLGLNWEVVIVCEVLSTVKILLGKSYLILEAGKKI